MEQLQAAGIAAAAVLTPADVLTDPQLVERGFVRVLMQPGWDPLFVEGDSVRCELVPETPLEPAPVHGEHTREIAIGVLGLSEHEVDDLVSSRRARSSPALTIRVFAPVRVLDPEYRGPALGWCQTLGWDQPRSGRRMARAGS